MPNIADIKVKISKIKKMVTKLSDRSMVAEPIIDTMIPIVKVLNI